MEKHVRETRATSLSGVLDELIEDTSGHCVSVGQLMEAFGTRAYGPLLLVPAIIAASPIGAIPGLSILMGGVIALVAIQLLVLQAHPWIPKGLEQFSFPREGLKRMVDLMRPSARKIDTILRQRLAFLMAPPFTQLIAIICLIMALLMFPLALVPFGVLLPGLAVGFLALGLAAYDGALVLGGLIVSLGTIALAGSWYLGGM